MKLDYPYTINVDWLQVFCHDRNSEPLHMYNGERSNYEFKLQPMGSRHFKEIWKVVNVDGDDYAIIQRVPHSSILSSDAAIVQLCNRELYKPFYASDFILFLKAHGFTYKSLSRLDICFDSNCLRNGLLHSTFIKRIMSGQYLKNNQSKVKWNFSAVASIGQPMECNSCSFGSLSSSVSSKMYNKTLELKEVKNKPYIVECWAYNNLDLNKDVWRIELSIKSDATNVVRTSDGEIFRLTPDYLKMQSVVEDIFFSYAKKYFSFKRNDGTKNKTRMKDVEIFPRGRVSTIHPVRVTKEKDSGRSDKIFLKKLHSLFGSLHNMDETTWAAIWEVSNAYTMSRGLSTWRLRRLLRDNPDMQEGDFQTEVHLSRIEALFDDLTRDCPHLKEEIHYYLQNIYSLIERERLCY